MVDPIVGSTNLGHVHSALLVCLPNPWYSDDRSMQHPHTTTLYICKIQRNPPALPIYSQVLEGQWGCALLFHYPPPPFLALSVLKSFMMAMMIT